jgi:hypothetical protein
MFSVSAPDSQDYLVQDRQLPDAPRARRLIAFALSAASRTSALTRKYAQERPGRPCIFSSFRTLYRERKRQPKHSQRLPHSLAHNENITLALSVSSALFLRSLALEPKLTPVFSIISALFRKKVGVGAKIPPSLSRFCILKRLHYMDRISTEQSAHAEPPPLPRRRDEPEPPSPRPVRNPALGNAIIRFSP